MESLNKLIIDITCKVLPILLSDCLFRKLVNTSLTSVLKNVFNLHKTFSLNVTIPINDKSILITLDKFSNNFIQANISFNFRDFTISLKHLVEYLVILYSKYRSSKVIEKEVNEVLTLIEKFINYDHVDESSTIELYVRYPFTLSNRDLKEKIINKVRFFTKLFTTIYNIINNPRNYINEFSNVVSDFLQHSDTTYQFFEDSLFLSSMRGTYITLDISKIVNMFPFVKDLYIVYYISINYIFDVAVSLDVPSVFKIWIPSKIGTPEFIELLSYVNQLFTELLRNKVFTNFVNKLIHTFSTIETLVHY